MSWSQTGFFVLLLSCLSWQGFAQDVRLNEAMFRNETTLNDADGDTPDWVELHNYGTESINLNGWGLSDDSFEPLKWQFPSQVLDPGQSLIVFASDKNRKGSELHTSFGVRHQEEGLYLSNANGTLLDSIPPSCTPSGVSIGRLGNDATLYRFNPPSPGESNSAADTTVLSLTPDTAFFSHPSGFHGSAFSLTLSSGLSDTRLLYTIDGSVPDDESAVYSSPFAISDRKGVENDLSKIRSSGEWKKPQGEVFKVTPMRVAPYRDGCRVGPIATNTYLVGEKLAERYPVPVVSLTTQKGNLFSDSRGIYVEGDFVNYARSGREWEREVHFEYFEKGGGLALEQDCGIRTHGQGSRRFPQKSLRLYARDSYGKSEFEHKFFPQTQLESFSRLVLRTAESDKLNSIFTDPLCHDLVQDFDMGQQAFQAVVVFINGEYWGVHNLRERQDNYYLESHTGISKDSFDILETTIIDQAAVSEGNTLHYGKLLNFLTDNDLSDPVNYAYVETQMDIDNFLDYYIAELYFSNFDWPDNNQKFWRPRTDAGRWRWLFFDCDNCMVETQLDHMRDFLDGNNFLNVYPGWSTLIIRKLLENERFRREFQARMLFHLNETFEPSRVIKRIREFRELYAPMMVEHIHRWNSPKTFDIWIKNTEQLEAFVLQRPAIMAAQMELYFKSPITLYPNPSVQNLQLLTNLSWDAPADIQVYDAMGRLVYREEWPQAANFEGWQLDVSAFKPGLYVFRLQYDRLVFREKFIVAGQVE